MTNTKSLSETAADLDGKTYMTTRQVLAMLQQFGFPITNGTIRKLIAPNCDPGMRARWNGGPPVAFYVPGRGTHRQAQGNSGRKPNRRPVFRPSDAIAWARSFEEHQST
jgi:hypothetical protein